MKRINEFTLPVKKKGRANERGELLKYFLERLNPDRLRSGYKPLNYISLAHYLPKETPTKDLYALKSKCDDAERRGYPWGAIFWKEIKG